MKISRKELNRGNQLILKFLGYTYNKEGMIWERFKSNKSKKLSWGSIDIKSKYYDFSASWDRIIPVATRLYDYCYDEANKAPYELDYFDQTFQTDDLLCEDGCKILWQRCVEYIEEINLSKNK